MVVSIFPENSFVWGAVILYEKLKLLPVTFEFKTRYWVINCANFKFEH